MIDTMLCCCHVGVGQDRLAAEFGLAISQKRRSGFFLQYHEHKRQYRSVLLGQEPAMFLLPCIRHTLDQILLRFCNPVSR